MQWILLERINCKLSWSGIVNSFAPRFALLSLPPSPMPMVMGSVVQEALRLLYSTQRSTLRTVAPSNYLVLLPRVLLDQVCSQTRRLSVDAVMPCAVHNSIWHDTVSGE